MMNGTTSAGLATAILMALAIPAPAFAQASNDSAGAIRGAPEAESADFAMKAAVSGLYEVEAGRIAASRAQDPAVRGFAEKMVADHTAANAELMRTAGTLQMPKQLDQPHADLIAALQSATNDFDRLYMQQQIEAHREAVSLFTAASTTGPNGALRAFAAKTQPVLQMHQEMAGQIGAKVGAGG